MTPLEGLVMGTRSGDLDPAILPYIMNESGMSASEMDTALNKQSGLVAISGQYSDRRDIRNAAAEGDERAALAIKLECYRLKKYIGAYTAAIGKVDALIMTAGVGEMAPHIREGASAGWNISASSSIVRRMPRRSAETQNWSSRPMIHRSRSSSSRPMRSWS